MTVGGWGEELARRSRRLEEGVAAVRVAYDGPERSATFSLVAAFRAPRDLRLIATKDLVLEQRPVFDLCLAGGEYVYSRWEEGGQETWRGDRGAFAAAHPELGGFEVVGEAVLLAGS